MDAIRIEGVWRGFRGRPVLRGADLRLVAGAWLGLAGANGAGKSTLLRLAAGLLVPCSGRIRVAGREPEAARRRGLVGWSGAADGGFTRRLSLRTNLELHARLRDVPPREIASRIGELADWLGFADHLDRPAERCSTGLRQRAALARAVLNAPPILLLDEPLRGVDAGSALALARELRRRLPASSALWVSHATDELAVGTDEVVQLDSGRLVGAACASAA